MTSSLRNCEYCGKEFIFKFKPSTRNKGKFCSKKCFYESRQMKRKCIQCGKEFVAAKSKVTEGKAIFCSKACFLEYSGRNQKTIQCVHCGKSFVVGTGRHDAKYCSVRCKRNHKSTSKICPVCGIQYRVSVGKLNKGFGIYCSSACWRKEQSLKHRVTKKCPTCGKDFTQTKGKKRKFCSRECANKGIVPWNKNKSGYINIKLRNRRIKEGTSRLCSCKWCGKVFYNPDWRIKMNMLCCCLEHARLYARHRNTVITKCKGCGQHFEVKLRNSSDKKGKLYRYYCSDECRGKYYDSVDGTCTRCGKAIKICRSEMKTRKTHFCSQECHHAFAQKENAPSWKGGFTILNTTGHKMVRTEDKFDHSHKGRENPANIYRPEHRVIVEKYIGRPLEKNGEPIFHLNGIPTDNRIENLYVFSSRSEMGDVIHGRMKIPQKSNIEKLRKDNQIMKGQSNEEVESSVTVGLAGADGGDILRMR